MGKIKNAKFQITGLVISIGLYLWSQYEWSKCPEIDCPESFIDHWLHPVESGSLFLIGFFTLFLILPSHYFKKWLKYIFSWGFPLSVYLTYITTGSNSIPAYDKVDVAQFWGMFFAVVTVIFIVVLKYLDWRQRRK